VERVSFLKTLDYDPMDPQNIADRAMDPDDGIDYEAIFIEMVESERAGTNIYFSNAESFLEWFKEGLERIVAELDLDVA
jgi:hypothetical protein